MNVRLRYVDVQISEPQFAGDTSPAPPVEPPQEFDLADGETISAINEWHEVSGDLGHHLALYARVWIAS